MDRAHSGASASIPTCDAAETADHWLAYLRTGRASEALMQEKGCGYVVPPSSESVIDRRLALSSPMRQIAAVRTVAVGPFRKPVSPPDAAMMALLEFPAADLYASPAATQSLLDDALVDLDEWLAAEVEDAFAAQETTAFVTGDGTNKPKGFLSYEVVPNAEHQWGQIGAVEWREADAVDALIDLVYAPKAQYRPNARFVMNRRTVSTIRRLKDGDGNYIWQPAVSAARGATLLGYPITEIETMPDMGSGKPFIAFGDFQKGYLIVDRAGVRVLRAPYSAKPYILFYTTKRVGGGVQNFDAIKVMTAPANRSAPHD